MSGKPFWIGNRPLIFKDITANDQKEARDWIAHLTEQRLKQEVARLEKEAQALLNQGYTVDQLRIVHRGNNPPVIMTSQQLAEITHEQGTSVQG